MPKIEAHEKVVPFLRKLPLQQVPDEIHHTTRKYFGWQSNRNSNPFFEQGTGLEGYFIHRSPVETDQIIEEMIDLGKWVVNAILKLYPHSIRRTDILRVLKEEKWDGKIFAELSALQGSLLGRLRAERLKDDRIVKYRTETDQLVDGVKMQYRQNEEGLLIAKYMLPKRDVQGATNLDLILKSLPEEKRFYLEVITLLGKVGHPLVRQMLEKR